MSGPILVDDQDIFYGSYQGLLVNFGLPILWAS